MEWDAKESTSPSLAKMLSTSIQAPRGLEAGAETDNRKIQSTQVSQLCGLHCKLQRRTESGWRAAAEVAANWSGAQRGAGGSPGRAGRRREVLLKGAERAGLDGGRMLQRSAAVALAPRAAARCTGSGLEELRRQSGAHRVAAAGTRLSPLHSLAARRGECVFARECHC